MIIPTNLDYNSSSTLKTIPKIIQTIYNDRPIRKLPDLVERTIGTENPETGQYSTTFKELKIDKTTKKETIKNSQTELSEGFEALEIYLENPSTSNLMALYMELSDVFFQTNILLEYAERRPGNLEGYQTADPAVFDHSLTKINSEYSKLLDNLAANGIHLPDIARIAELKYQSRIDLGGKNDKAEKIAVAKYLFRQKLFKPTA